MILLASLPACSDYGLSDPDVAEAESVGVEERFEQVPLPGLDVLLVVDGTGSMAEEQAAFAADAEAFVGALDAMALAWQVGVTSTDPADGGDLLGEPWIIAPLTPEPAAALAGALAVGTGHAPPSAGLDAAALALVDAAGHNRGFRRDDAALHVIFVSDDDDESGAVLGADPVGGLVARLAAEGERTGHAAAASAVVGDVPGGCAGPRGQARAGPRYAEVAAATGGVVASICGASFAQVAEAVFDVAVEWTTRFALQATPVADSVRVTVDGALATDWSLEESPPAIAFAVPPPAGAVIVVRYDLAAGG